jgi:hypothetical protein
LGLPQSFSFKNKNKKLKSRNEKQQKIIIKKKPGSLAIRDLIGGK